MQSARSRPRRAAPSAYTSGRLADSLHRCYFRKEPIPMRKTIMTLVALIASASLAVAQETTGTISGQVIDSQGLAVPGVAVTITGTQGAKTVTTDAEGRFDVPFLTPGRYTVRAELQGFKAVEQSNVTVGLGQTVQLPISMSVGGVTEDRKST